MEEFRSQMGWGKEKIPEYVLKCFEIVPVREIQEVRKTALIRK